MKRLEFILMLFLAVIIAIPGNAQNDEKVFYVVEEMPEFSGGKSAMQKYMSDNVKYPESAKKEGVTGKVFVSFVISKNGKVKDAKVVRSVDSTLDKEALRVIKSMPDWVPGKQRGKKVDVQFTLPINFALGEDK